MKILFWNTHENKGINRYIVNLVQDYCIDLLILAEYAADRDVLSALLSAGGQRLTYGNTLGCDRIHIWSNYVNMKAGVQDTYYSVQIIQDELILCCVHLVTDLHGDRSDERLAIIQRIMHDIEMIENEIKSQKTIIIGDINEMPYSRGCLNANGFHGLPTLDVGDKSTRKVNGVAYRKFYNPMWSLMGDFSYPPGTYYKNQAKLHSPMWYMHDQVILSKDILRLFNKDSLQIITSCSGADFMDKNRHPNKKISDHFPIMCEIRDE
ncbi:MAG: endonuclease/exonuclease/phosphatase [Lachnospiraceae bacterium]|nr:endonuclease/exonuclease/phosphatase [Lachnospiraceae bacterium]